MMSPRLLSLVAVVLAGAAMRLVPHPPNFTPIVAMALFGGTYFSNRRMAFAVPLGAMLVSDIVLAVVVYGLQAFIMIPFVYLAFALIVLLGRSLRQRASVPAVGMASVVSAVILYLVTNFGAWLVGHGYPLTGNGLVACYVAGIPFFKYTLASSVIYSAILFGGFALLQWRFEALREVTPAKVTCP